MKIALISFTFIIMLLSKNAWAIIKFEDAIFPELVISTRAQAMGNAFIAKVDDASAAFYNPAGLGSHRRKVRFRLSSFYLETNQGLLDTTIFDTFKQSFDIENNRQILLVNRGIISHSRFQLMPNFTYKNLTAGFLYSRRSRATIGNSPTAMYEFAQRSDAGPYVGVNYSFWGGVLKFGATGTLLFRREIITERDRTIPLNINSDNFDRGRAFMVTGGARLTLPIKYLPTCGVTLHNVTNTDFTASSSGTGAPAKKRQSLDAGCSLTMILKNRSKLHFEVNLKDIGNDFTEVDERRKLGIGIEYDFSRFSYLRFGYGDGFGSAGLGFRTRALDFNLTTYAVDTTSAEFQGEQDRRYSAELSIGF